MSSFKKLFTRLFTAKRPFKLTKAGWVFILYTIGVGAGAINTGNNLLYLVFGVFLGLILASGLLSDLSLWNLEVEWDLPDSFIADELCVIPLHVTNGKKRFSSFSVQIEVEASVRGETIRLKTHVPFVGPGETAPVHLSFVPRRRGWFQIQQIRLTTQYPFGLLRKWWVARREEGSLQAGTFIYPSIFPLESFHMQSFRLGEAPSATAGERGEGPNFYGLREYQASDNPRRIHWKVSAKNNTSDDERPNWFIREMEKEHELDILLHLPRPEELAGMPPSQVEQMVRYAASLVEACRKEGRRARLMVEGQAVGTDPQAEWQFLSLWDPSQELGARLSAALLPLAGLPPFSVGVSKMDLLPIYHKWRLSEDAERRTA